MYKTGLSTILLPSTDKKLKGFSSEGLDVPFACAGLSQLTPDLGQCGGEEMHIQCPGWQGSGAARSVGNSSGCCVHYMPCNGDLVFEGKLGGLREPVTPSEGSVAKESMQLVLLLVLAFLLCLSSLVRHFWTKSGASFFSPYLFASFPIKTVMQTLLSMGVQPDKG